LGQNSRLTINSKRLIWINVNKKQAKKTLFVLIVIAIIGLIVVSYLKSITPNELSWESTRNRHLKNNEKAMVICCIFYSTMPKDFLESYQFELSDYLTSAQFYILDSTEDIEMNKITIKYNDEIQKEYNLMKVPGIEGKIPVSYIAENLNVFNPYRLDKEGVWTITFDTNNSYVAVYEFDGAFGEFDKSKEVNSLGLGIKALEILSPSVVQQIKVGKVSETLLTVQEITIPITIGVD